MKYPWIDEYLLSLRGVTKDFQPEWNWVRYHTGGKMFAAVCRDDADQPVYITLKLEPTEGEFWRRQYPAIIPGYYMNKLHWNSVKADGMVPEDVVKTLLAQAYRLVLRSLPKAKQRETLGLTVCGTDCSVCPLHGTTCAVCNEVCGKVFHSPTGRSCAIYACCASKHHYATCADCSELPCAIWQITRDPSMTNEQFQASVENRVSLLKSATGN